MDDLDNYLKGLTRALARIDRAVFVAVVDTVKQAHAADKVVYICGNGGSAATASHMANDLLKAPAQATGCRPIRAIALTDCVPLMTALANDLDYSQIFARQLGALGREGDLLITISASGNSPNVLEAAQTARKMGMKVVGLTGFQGGKLKDLVDIHLNVPSTTIAIVEDAHLIIEHALVETLKVSL